MIRGIVKSVVEGVIKRFSATGRVDEDIDNREYFQHYGYTSRPKPGAELIIIREGNQIVAIASDDRRYRIALEEGEVALYTDEGDKIHLKRGRIIEITGGEKIVASTKVAEITASTSTTVTSPVVTVNASTSATVTSPTVTVVASTKVRLETPLVECTGNLSVAGGITSTGTYGASGGKIQTPGDISSTGGNVSDSLRTMAADRLIYNSHTHPENGTGGGTTSAPNEAM